MLIRDQGCGRTMGTIWESPPVDVFGTSVTLWLENEASLDDPNTGKTWKDKSVEPIASLDAFLRLDCPGAGKRPDCAQAASWSLSEAKAELAKARATGAAVEVIYA